ncbi:MAG TPA: IclR family transcriptional regulator [Xanthobacteraceae bacterium]|nr:IclR family transcriptional regulator [Xanthobacteraceae bacterium]
MTLQTGPDLRDMTAPASRGRANGGSDRKFVSALARGLEVLRAFTPSEGLLGNGELVQRTGLPKPTVTRLTYTLTKLGYLTYVERLGKYQLAPAALALGYSALANLRVRQIARAAMQKLADYADASVALGTRDRLDLIYVEHCRSKHGMMLRLGLGSRIPIATTAMGRALLAGLPETERDWLLGYLRREAGKAWPKLRAGIERAIEDVATRGFTLALGEWERDINAVGVPLLAPDGSGAFAFNCGAPSFHFTRDRLERDIGPRLVNLVRNVEVELSGR